MAQDSQNTFGKTEKEIIAMGETAWHDFYVKQTADSTADESNAYGIYATVMQKRNDQLIAQTHNKQAAKIRKYLTDGGNDLTDLGSNISEGGTIWNIIDANMAADIEDAINGYLEKKPAPKEHYVVSDVEKQFSVLAKKIEESHKDTADTMFHYADARKSLADARKNFKLTVEFASHCSRADSDRFLAIFVDFAKAAEGMA
jgi:hypothetical protein